MTFRVITAPEADRHLTEIDRWWRENRLAAPDLFLREFAGASELIAVAPHAGRLYRDAHFPHVRRLLMRATRYHVYYVLQGDEVVIIAVWSAVRGTGPDLRP
ncbi:MAG: type II toxin-antitoxin system RelE/ParE family toxin [Planctomycetota bacterium]